MRSVEFIDSHTGGEPTRVILADDASLLTDLFRKFVINEPRGSEVLVGAIVSPATDAGCVAKVTFFNNVGLLGMCGHGMIGVVVTLGYLGKLSAGRHRLETPVGEVTVDFDGQHGVSVGNVASYRTHRRLALEVPRLGSIHGDVAYGGNWFFLVEDHGIAVVPEQREALFTAACAIRQSLSKQGITGDYGAEIDHIELFGPASGTHADSRNYVLCPGYAYDRSPCGTGTSAKLACLIADGKLTYGDIWRQESIIGSVFVAVAERDEQRADAIRPSIRGSAFVTAHGKLLLDANDPFPEGISG